MRYRTQPSTLSAYLALILTVYLLLPAFAVSNTFKIPHHLRDLSQKSQIQFSKIHENDLKAIMRRISGDVHPSNCLDNGQQPTIWQILRKFRIAKVTLTADNNDQYVVQAWACNCGGTGNCDIWILQHDQKGWGILYHNGGFNGFSIEDTISHGYKDLIFSSHDSASATEIFAYQFDGHEYRPVQCFKMDYWDWQKSRVLKKPVFSEFKCRG
jgi:hypothetical protein